MKTADELSEGTHYNLLYNIYMYHRDIHVLMRDEKEGRKKQARSYKQQSKATQHTCTCMYVHCSSAYLPKAGCIDRVQVVSLTEIEVVLVDGTPRQTYPLLVMVVVL